VLIVRLHARRRPPASAAGGLMLTNERSNQQARRIAIPPGGDDDVVLRLAVWPFLNEYNASVDVFFVGQIWIRSNVTLTEISGKRWESATSREWFVETIII